MKIGEWGRGGQVLYWNFRTIYMGARNRVGNGLSYRPARLHRLAEYIPWNRFLGSLKVSKYSLRSWRKKRMKIREIDTAECDHRYRYLDRKGHETRLKIRWTQSRGNISHVCKQIV